MNEYATWLRRLAIIAVAGVYFYVCLFFLGLSVAIGPNSITGGVLMGALFIAAAAFPVLVAWRFPILRPWGGA